ncbi:hypothetical protein [Nonomuraea sp. NEAU-A123]|uniref:hypothetical protein n=1 Tax=Nonomuraea sp. NEAU-A123 TaxID=2839649 RepID=UPI001BE4DCAC|nr:hypothetical protein [Nonomuraea sp. NEAU-A123]MBT2233591.1 hypothetical protein [Nonomuraea sp. NEAU-A123]
MAGGRHAGAAGSVLVPRPGTTITLDEIRTTMERGGVARFKIPEHLVIVDELISTKVGKIDKKALRAGIARRLEPQAST